MGSLDKLSIARSRLPRYTGMPLGPTTGNVSVTRAVIGAAPLIAVLSLLSGKK